MFAGNNALQVYKDFFMWSGKPEMFKTHKNRTLEYADLAPLAYLHVALEGLPAPSRIKHLLIDEMQDYSPIQYKMIQKLYSCRKTILGDACQSVNPYGSSTAEMIQKAFVTGKVMKLCKSYRSTFEISNFASKDSSERRLGSHCPTWGCSYRTFFQESGRRTFRHLGDNYHIQKVELQITRDNMQNRSASTRNHGKT